MVWKRKKRESDPLKYASTLMRYRPRSEKEMRERLSKRFPADVVEETIRVLKERGLLDDERFALMMARSELAKLHGPRMIRSKLLSLGVEEEYIETALERAMREFDISGEIERLRKRMDGRKLREYLYRRGFDPKILENDPFDG